MNKALHKTLIFCLFAVLCQLCGIMLYFSIYKDTGAPELLVRECAQMLEYSLVSIAVICAGGAIFSRTSRESA